MAVVVDDALSVTAGNLIQKRREFKAPAISFGPTRKNHGFCEGCQTVKPAPKKRNKGWRCTDCSQ